MTPAFPTDQPTVGLFVTCLVDLYRPTVGLAAVQLLEEAGCSVVVPDAQTCCGQPAYNAGDLPNSQAIARSVIAHFLGFDYVVAPSGSCAGMIKAHYPRLLDDDPEWQHKALALAERTYELVSFLVDVRGMTEAPHATARQRSVTYHDSCSGLRELGVKTQPRALLSKVPGLTLTELPGAEVCCGFGGTFCVKYPEISNRMVEEKTDDIAATGTDLLLAGDMGCLLNIAGKLKRQGRHTEVRHVAEVLAGLTDRPGIGEANS